MEQKVYSLDQEHYHDTLEEAIEMQIHNYDMDEEILVYEATKKSFKLSDFLTNANLDDSIVKLAAYQSGELSDHWCDRFLDNFTSFEQFIKDKADEWAKTNQMEPSFWNVESVDSFLIKFINPKTFEWVRVEQAVEVK